MAGNICRCATYHRIRAAIHAASAQLRPEEARHAPADASLATRDARRPRSALAAPGATPRRADGCRARASCCQRRRAASSIGFGWLAPARRARPPPPGAEGAAAGPLAPNAFVRVGTDNLVTVVCKHHEMGQGNTTGLATLVADELDADWSLVRTEYAPSESEALRQPRVRPMQGTGGSSAIANSYLQYRTAGATARAMLVAAAAEAWKVPAGEITTAKSVLTPCLGQARHATARWPRPRARQPAPAKPALKTPAQFTLIGKDRSTPRVDSPSKCNGTRRSTRSTSSCRAC